MNIYLRTVLIVTGSHLARCMAEYMYYTQCAGFWNSIFAWNSPMCRGLRWTADSVMMNAVTISALNIKRLEEFIDW